MHSRCRLWVQAVWKLIHRRNVENTIPQHGIQPYVRSIISSHIAQFLKNISTRAADVEVFTQPGPKADSGAAWPARYRLLLKWKTAIGLPILNRVDGD